MTPRRIREHGQVSTGQDLYDDSGCLTRDFAGLSAATDQEHNRKVKEMFDACFGDHPPKAISVPPFPPKMFNCKCSSEDDHE